MLTHKINRRNKFLIFISVFLYSVSCNSQEIRIGGSLNDFITGVAEDNNENVFIIGYTNSGDFPIMATSYDNTFNGESDIFICKFNKDLTDLIASTFIGGSEIEQSGGIAIAPNGDVYITGYTKSANLLSKKTIGLDKDLDGPSDIFIMRLSNDLKNVKSSTYVGGNDNEGAHYINIVLDANTNVILSGITSSTNFPVKDGSYDNKLEGKDDLFISKYNSDLSEQLGSTLIGGNGWEISTGVKINECGDIYIAGHTTSTNFPCTKEAFKKEFDGVRDIYASKFNSELTELISSTLLPGNEYDCGYCMNLDTEGNILVGGMTLSNNYYTTKGVFKESFLESDEFETNFSVLNNDLSKIVHSTYIGGKGSAGGVVKLNDGRYFISGYAFGDIKLVNGNNNYKYHGGESDGFFTVFDSDLSNCQFFGYIGGAERDAVDGHILLNNGNVLMFGTTESEIFYGGSSSSSWGKCKNNDVFIKIINPKSFMK